MSSGGVRRTLLTPAETAVQRFGAELFDLLFTGEVRNRYDVSRERAQYAGKGLRIRLRSQSAMLANLPWEYLHDPRLGQYLCLSQQTPLVRYLELPQPIQPLLVTPPLRILALIAAPSDLPPLDVTVERQRLERAIAPLQTANLVELHWLESATGRDLQRALRRGQWQIFHFIGHGDFDQRREEGLIALCDDAGKAQLFTAGDLGELLADHRTLRLAVLNACSSAQGSSQDRFAGTAATLVRSGIPAVIAMQHAITDRAAIEFSQTFYESLADGLPVDGAVSEARKAIRLGVTNTLEWGTPVLYSRAPDGELFTVAAQAERERQETRDRETRDRETRDTSGATRATPSAPRYPQTTIPFDWVTIPAGEFIMGSDKAKDPAAYDDELPQFRLYLPEYRIMRGPLTNAQYKQFVAATGYRAPEHWKGGKIPNGKEDHPVVSISWHDALAFCEWAKVRLPTEAEWEKAARGTDGRIYPWGNNAPDKTLCNFNMNEGDTTPVGKYPKGASPYDCLDMAGNVWEWTSSLWGKDISTPTFTYPYQPNDGREDLSADNDTQRVVRGGSFGDYDMSARAACRYRDNPDNRDHSVGVRFLLSPSLL